MQRRTAVGRMATALAGLSLGEVPDLEASAALPGEAFSVTAGNLPESSGIVTCAQCHEMADSLGLTPAGLCLRCADRDPAVRVEPYSDRFWILSPQEVRRLESEIQRLAAELDRMNQRLTDLKGRQLAEGSDVYDRAIEAERKPWHALQRELHLLHLLRAASRQFASPHGSL
jgi:hypothetical protein